MNLYLQIVFIFFIGSMLGWVIELFYRRILHKKWVNPGFLIGPYLPIYGFGLVFLSIMYFNFYDKFLNPFIMILLMGLGMTLIELIGGLIGLKNNVRLWDYRDEWCNFKGIICPLYSAIWTGVGAIYYFFLAPYVISALVWFSKNIVFSYFLGIFTGTIIIDLVYSSKLYIKIRRFAKDNDVVVRYEQFKLHIKEVQIKAREKYSFLNPFKQSKPLLDYLNTYKDKIINELKK